MKGKQALTDDERSSCLLDIALELYEATLENRPDKLTVKIEMRDTISHVLADTVASGIAEDLQDEFAPHCIPFDEEKYLSTCVLAQVVAGGRSALLKAYKVRILEADMGGYARIANSPRRCK